MMMRFATGSILFVLILVTLFGMGIAAYGCSKAVMQHMGMLDCPQAFMALIHHLDAFSSALAASAVATVIFIALLQTFLHWAAVPLIGAPAFIAVRNYERDNRSAVILSLPQQLFRKGILHRKDAPAFIR